MVESLRATLAAVQSERAAHHLHAGRLLRAAKAYAEARRHAEAAGLLAWADELAEQAHRCRELYL
jgi:hypothetical protein